MSEPSFTVSVKDLEEGTREYVFPIHPEWVRDHLEEGEIRATKTEGALTVRLSKSGKDVVVQGHVKGELEVPCARCMQPAVVAVSADLTALMVPAGSSTPETERDPDVVPFDGQTVVLDDLVRDEILLEIPMMPLCSDACPGMEADSISKTPPTISVDPRLEPLRRVKLPKE